MGDVQIERRANRSDYLLLDNGSDNCFPYMCIVQKRKQLSNPELASYVVKSSLSDNDG